MPPSKRTLRLEMATMTEYVSTLTASVCQRCGPAPKRVMMSEACSGRGALMPSALSALSDALAGQQDAPSARWPFLSPAMPRRSLAAQSRHTTLCERSFCSVDVRPARCDLQLKVLLQINQASYPTTSSTYMSAVSLGESRGARCCAPPRDGQSEGAPAR